MNAEKIIRFERARDIAKNNSYKINVTNRIALTTENDIVIRHFDTSDDFFYFMLGFDYAWDILRDKYKFKDENSLQDYIKQMPKEWKDKIKYYLES